MSRRIKTILITGVTGSGGSYLAEHILNKKKKIKIFGIYRRKKKLKDIPSQLRKKIKYYKCDLINFKKLSNILNKIKPDVIFHLATHANVRESFDKPIMTTRNNTVLTVNLLEAIKKLNISPLIIICSSSEVYGNVKLKDMPITENQKISPINPYAATKAFQDMISQIYHNCFDLKIIITRMFTYTNARNLKLFQTAFAKKIIEIEKGKINLLNHGNLNSVRSILDKDDAMEAYWLAAKKGKIGEIYNIGGNKIISVKKFLKELIKLSKCKVKCSTDEKLLRPQDVTMQIPSSRKFNKDTGWKPKINLHESVKKLLNECRKIYN